MRVYWRVPTTLRIDGLGLSANHRFSLQQDSCSPYITNLTESGTPMQMESLISHHTGFVSLNSSHVENPFFERRICLYTTSMPVSDFSVMDYSVGGFFFYIGVTRLEEISTSETDIRSRRWYHYNYNNHLYLPYGATSTHLVKGTFMDLGMHIRLSTDWRCDSGIFANQSFSSIYHSINITNIHDGERGFSSSGEITFKQPMTTRHVKNLRICVSLWDDTSSFIDTGFLADLLIDIEGIQTYDVNTSPDSKIILYKGNALDVVLSGHGFYGDFADEGKTLPGDVGTFLLSSRGKYQHRAALLSSCTTSLSYDEGDYFLSEINEPIFFSNVYFDRWTNLTKATLEFQLHHVNISIDVLYLCISEYPTGTDFSIHHNRYQFGIMELTSIDGHPEITIPYGTVSVHGVNGLLVGSGQQIKLIPSDQNCNDSSIEGLLTPMNITGDSHLFDYETTQVGYNATFQFTSQQSLQHTHYLVMCVSPFKQPSTQFFSSGLHINIHIEVHYASSYNRWHGNSADVIFGNEILLYHMYETSLSLIGFGFYPWVRVAFFPECSEKFPFSQQPKAKHSREIRWGRDSELLPMNLNVNGTESASVNVSFVQVQNSFFKKKICISEYPGIGSDSTDSNLGIMLPRMTDWVTAGYATTDLFFDFSIDTDLYITVVELKSIDNATDLLAVPYSVSSPHRLEGVGLLNYMRLRFVSNDLPCNYDQSEFETTSNITDYSIVLHGDARDHLHKTVYFQIPQTKRHTITTDNNNYLKVCLSLYPAPHTNFFDTRIQLDVQIRLNTIYSYDFPVQHGGVDKIVRVYKGHATTLEVSGHGYEKWIRIAILPECVLNASSYISDHPYSNPITISGMEDLIYGNWRKANFTLGTDHVSEAFENRKICLSQYESGNDFSIDSNLFLSVVEIEYICKGSCYDVSNIVKSKQIEIPYGSIEPNEIIGTAIKSDMQLKVAYSCMNTTQLDQHSTFIYDYDNPVNISNMSGRHWVQFSTEQTLQHSLGLRLCISLWPEGSPYAWLDTGISIDITVRINAITSYDVIRYIGEDVRIYHKETPVLTIHGHGFHHWHRISIQKDECGDNVDISGFSSPIFLFGIDDNRTIAYVNITGEHTSVPGEYYKLCLSVGDGRSASRYISPKSTFGYHAVDNTSNCSAYISSGEIPHRYTEIDNAFECRQAAVHLGLSVDDDTTPGVENSINNITYGIEGCYQRSDDNLIYYNDRHNPFEYDDRNKLFRTPICRDRHIPFKSAACQGTECQNFPIFYTRNYLTVIIVYSVENPSGVYAQTLNLPYGSTTNHSLRGVGLFPNEAQVLLSRDCNNPTFVETETPFNLTVSGGASSGVFWEDINEGHGRDGTGGTVKLYEGRYRRHRSHPSFGHDVSFTLSHEQTMQHSIFLDLCISVYPWPNINFVRSGVTVNIELVVREAYTPNEIVKFSDGPSLITPHPEYQHGSPTELWKAPGMRSKCGSYSFCDEFFFYKLYNDTARIEVSGHGLFSHQRVFIRDSLNCSSNISTLDAATISDPIYFTYLNNWFNGYYQNASIILTRDHVAFSYGTRSLCISEYPGVRSLHPINRFFQNSELDFRIHSNLYISVIELKQVQVTYQTLYGDVSLWTKNMTLYQGRDYLIPTESVGMRPGMQVKADISCDEKTPHGIYQNWERWTSMNLTSDGNIKFTNTQTNFSRFVRLCVNPELSPNSEVWYDSGIIVNIISPTITVVSPRMIRVSNRYDLQEGYDQVIIIKGNWLSSFDYINIVDSGRDCNDVFQDHNKLGVKNEPIYLNTLRDGILLNAVNPPERNISFPQRVDNSISDTWVSIHFTDQTQTVLNISSKGNKNICYHHASRGEWQLLPQFEILVQIEGAYNYTSCEYEQRYKPGYSCITSIGSGLNQYSSSLLHSSLSWFRDWNDKRDGREYNLWEIILKNPDVFTVYDTDRSGSLSLSEIAVLLQAVKDDALTLTGSIVDTSGIPSNEYIMRVLDVDRSLSVDLSEIIPHENVGNTLAERQESLYYSPLQYLQLERSRILFYYLDINRNGYVEIDEVKYHLGPTADYLNASSALKSLMLTEIVTDDGRVSMSEFLSVSKQQFWTCVDTNGYCGVISIAYELVLLTTKTPVTYEVLSGPRGMRDPSHSESLIRKSDPEANPRYEIPSSSYARNYSESDFKFLTDAFDNVSNAYTRRVTDQISVLNLLSKKTPFNGISQCELLSSAIDILYTFDSVERDGMLSKEEFGYAMQNCDQPERSDEVNELFTDMDIDKDGFCSLSEISLSTGSMIAEASSFNFTNLVNGNNTNTLVLDSIASLDLLISKFRICDLNYDGLLSQEEGFSFFEMEFNFITNDDVNQIFDHFDRNKDDFVSLSEMLYYLSTEVIGLRNTTESDFPWFYPLSTTNSLVVSNIAIGPDGFGKECSVDNPAGDLEYNTPGTLLGYSPIGHSIPNAYDSSSTTAKSCFYIPVSGVFDICYKVGGHSWGYMGLGSPEKIEIDSGPADFSTDFKFIYELENTDVTFTGSGLSSNDLVAAVKITETNPTKNNPNPCLDTSNHDLINTSSSMVKYSLTDVIFSMKFPFPGEYIICYKAEAALYWESMKGCEALSGDKIIPDIVVVRRPSSLWPTDSISSSNVVDLVVYNGYGLMKYPLKDFKSPHQLSFTTFDNSCSDTTNMIPIQIISHNDTAIHGLLKPIYSNTTEVVFICMSMYKSQWTSVGSIGVIQTSLRVKYFPTRVTENAPITVTTFGSDTSINDGIGWVPYLQSCNSTKLNPVAKFDSGMTIGILIVSRKDRYQTGRVQICYYCWKLNKMVVAASAVLPIEKTLLYQTYPSTPVTESTVQIEVFYSLTRQGVWHTPRDRVGFIKYNSNTGVSCDSVHTQWSFIDISYNTTNKYQNSGRKGVFGDVGGSSMATLPIFRTPGVYMFCYSNNFAPFHAIGNLLEVAQIPQEVTPVRMARNEETNVQFFHHKGLVDSDLYGWAEPGMCHSPTATHQYSSTLSTLIMVTSWSVSVDICFKHKQDRFRKISTIQMFPGIVSSFTSNPLNPAPGSSFTLSLQGQGFNSLGHDIIFYPSSATIYDSTTEVARTVTSTSTPRLMYADIAIDGGTYIAVVIFNDTIQVLSGQHIIVTAGANSWSVSENDESPVAGITVRITLFGSQLSLSTQQDQFGLCSNTSNGPVVAVASYVDVVISTIEVSGLLLLNEPGSFFICFKIFETDHWSIVNNEKYSIVTLPSESYPPTVVREGYLELYYNGGSETLYQKSSAEQDQWSIVSPGQECGSTVISTGYFSERLTVEGYVQSFGLSTGTYKTCYRHRQNSWAPTGTITVLPAGATEYSTRLQDGHKWALIDTLFTVKMIFPRSIQLAGLSKAGYVMKGETCIPKTELNTTRVDSTLGIAEYDMTVTLSSNQRSLVSADIDICHYLELTKEWVRVGKTMTVYRSGGHSFRYYPEPASPDPGTPTQIQISGNGMVSGDSIIITPTADCEDPKSGSFPTKVFNGSYSTVSLEGIHISSTGIMLVCYNSSVVQGGVAYLLPGEIVVMTYEIIPKGTSALVSQDKGATQIGIYGGIQSSGNPFIRIAPFDSDTSDPCGNSAIESQLTSPSIFVNGTSLITTWHFNSPGVYAVCVGKLFIGPPLTVSVIPKYATPETVVTNVTTGLTLLQYNPRNGDQILWVEQDTPCHLGMVSGLAVRHDINKKSEFFIKPDTTSEVIELCYRNIYEGDHNDNWIRLSTQIKISQTGPTILDITTSGRMGTSVSIKLYGSSISNYHSYVSHVPSGVPCELQESWSFTSGDSLSLNSTSSYTSVVGDGGSSEVSSYHICYFHLNKFWIRISTITLYPVAVTSYTTTGMVILNKPQETVVVVLSGFFFSSSDVISWGKDDCLGDSTQLTNINSTTASVTFDGSDFNVTGSHQLCYQSQKYGISRSLSGLGSDLVVRKIPVVGPGRPFVLTRAFQQLKITDGFMLNVNDEVGYVHDTVDCIAREINPVVWFDLSSDKLSANFEIDLRFDDSGLNPKNFIQFCYKMSNSNFWLNLTSYVISQPAETDSWDCSTPTPKGTVDEVSGMGTNDYLGIELSLKFKGSGLTLTDRYVIHAVPLENKQFDCWGSSTIANSIILTNGNLTSGKWTPSTPGEYYICYAIAGCGVYVPVGPMISIVKSASAVVLEFPDPVVRQTMSITITGGGFEANSFFSWISNDLTCDATTTSSTRTPIDKLVSETEVVGTVAFYNPGVFVLCFRISDGDWHPIGSTYITVVRLPSSFNPGIAVIGTPTKLSFTGGKQLSVTAEDRMMIVASGAECGSGFPAFLLGSSTVPVAPITMPTEAGEYKVCYRYKSFPWSTVPRTLQVINYGATSYIVDDIALYIGKPFVLDFIVTSSATDTMNSVAYNKTENQVSWVPSSTPCVAFYVQNCSFVSVGRVRAEFTIDIAMDVDICFRETENSDWMKVGSSPLSIKPPGVEKYNIESSSAIMTLGSTAEISIWGVGLSFIEGTDLCFLVPQFVKCQDHYSVIMSEETHPVLENSTYGRCVLNATHKPLMDICYKVERTSYSGSWSKIGSILIIAGVYDLTGFNDIIAETTVLVSLSSYEIDTRKLTDRSVLNTFVVAINNKDSCFTSSPFDEYLQNGHFFDLFDTSDGNNTIMGTATVPFLGRIKLCARLPYADGSGSWHQVGPVYNITRLPNYIRPEDVISNAAHVILTLYGGAYLSSEYGHDMIGYSAILDSIQNCTSDSLTQSAFVSSPSDTNPTTVISIPNYDVMICYKFRGNSWRSISPLTVRSSGVSSFNIGGNGVAVAGKDVVIQFQGSQLSGFDTVTWTFPDSSCPGSDTLPVVVSMATSTSSEVTITVTNVDPSIVNSDIRLCYKQGSGSNSNYQYVTPFLSVGVGKRASDFLYYPSDLVTLAPITIMLSGIGFTLPGQLNSAAISDRISYIKAGEGTCASSTEATQNSKYVDEIRSTKWSRALITFETTMTVQMCFSVDHGIWHEIGSPKEVVAYPYQFHPLIVVKDAYPLLMTFIGGQQLGTSVTEYLNIVPAGETCTFSYSGFQIINFAFPSVNIKAPSKAGLYTVCYKHKDNSWRGLNSTYLEVIEDGATQFSLLPTAPIAGELIQITLTGTRLSGSMRVKWVDQLSSCVEEDVISQTFDVSKPLDQPDTVAVGMYFLFFFFF